MELEASYRGRSLRGWLSHSRVARGETQPREQRGDRADGRKIAGKNNERERSFTEREKRVKEV